MLAPFLFRTNLGYYNDQRHQRLRHRPFIAYSSLETRRAMWYAGYCKCPCSIRLYWKHSCTEGRVPLFSFLLFLSLILSFCLVSFSSFLSSFLHSCAGYGNFCTLNTAAERADSSSRLAICIIKYMHLFNFWGIPFAISVSYTCGIWGIRTHEPFPLERCSLTKKAHCDTAKKSSTLTTAPRRELKLAVFLVVCMLS